MAFRLPFVSQILSQWVSTAVLNWDILPPRGHLAMSGDILGGHNWGRRCVAPGIQQVEGREAAKHSRK